MGQFDRFTPRARRVLDHAREFAKSLNHSYIGTEHLLVGILKEDGVATRVLSTMGLPDAAAIISQLEFIAGKGKAPVDSEITLTPRAKSVINLAVTESSQLGHRHIGTEHLLLGLVQEGEGIAGSVLETLGVRYEDLRFQVIEAVSKRPQIKVPLTAEHEALLSELVDSIPLPILRLGLNGEISLEEIISVHWHWPELEAEGEISLEVFRSVRSKALDRWSQHQNKVGECLSNDTLYLIGLGRESSNAHLVACPLCLARFKAFRFMYGLP